MIIYMHGYQQRRKAMFNKDTQEIKLFAETLQKLRVEFLPDFRLGRGVAHSISGSSEEIFTTLEGIYDALTENDERVVVSGDWLLVKPWMMGRGLRPVPVLKSERENVMNLIHELIRD
jgi:hypothetical protein